MEKGVTKFPFNLLKNDVYLILDVMMYVERPKPLEFMFSVSKEARTFILQNYITI
jgi:hypothetical protein